MAATTPFAYYRMSNLNVGTQTITDVYGYANFVGTGGIVYSALNEYNQTVLRLSSTTDSFVATSSVQKIINSFSVEFTIRLTNHYFNGGQIFSIDNGSVSIYFKPFVNSSVPTFFLRTTHIGNIEKTHEFSFSNLNREDFRYLNDGRTHHIVFTYNATTGIKKLYIDGQNPPNFTGTTNITGNLYAPGTNHSLRIHSNTSYRKFQADFNHLALYDAVISDKQIYDNYLSIMSGGNYTFVENSTTPEVENTTGSYNPLDFAPGTDLNTNGLTQGVTVDQLSQLQRFPLPRYKSGHTMMRLFNWFTVNYIAQSGGIITGPTPSLVSYAKNLMLEFSNNWFYYLPVSYNQDPTLSEVTNPTNTWTGMLVKLANENPQIPTQHINLRIQLPGNRLYDKTFGRNYYLQNGAGQFVDVNGNPTVVLGSKVWRPLESTLSFYRPDGDIVKNTFNNILLPALSGRSTPRINIINENGEIVYPLTDSVLNLDSQFVSERNTAGYSSSNSYFGLVYKKVMRDNFADMFLTAATLSGAVYTEYTINGLTDGSDEPLYTKKWSETRLINTQINSQYYSTGDFYPRWPYNWRNWISSWHGLQWFVQSRYEELSYGDALFSPFISAGWDIDERKNIRPAQWLGLLKVLNLMGAEFFYTGLFNETAPFPNPKNYIWQMVMPAYAQAITSRYESILRDGRLLDGDYPREYDPPQTNGPGYNYYTGDLRKFCAVKQMGDEYIIASTINPVNNYSGGVEDHSVTTIILNDEPIKFNTRRQGSVYYYKPGVEPVFYQLDDWHENTHPYYWDSDIKISTPLYDYSIEQIPIKTEKTGGTYDFTAFTSYISFSSATSVDYLISPRSGITHYCWIRARSLDGSSTGFSVRINNGASYPVGCIKNTNWNWYRRQSTGTTGMSFLLSSGTNVLTITSNNKKLEISDIHISSSSSQLYPEGTPSAIGLPPIIVSSGGTVVLSAASGSSYFWIPTSETTQVITAITSGTYYVLIDDGAGCTATTNSIEVIVNADEFLTTASALGPTTFAPGGNVVLSASTLYYLTGITQFNYSWYSAATALDNYVLAGTGNSYTATSTGYYYVNTISTATTNSLSSNTIYVNANSASTANGTTTETKIIYPLTYTNLDNEVSIPWESSTIDVLDITERGYYVFVKIRSRTGEKTGVKASLDGGINFASITNIDRTSFGWYRIGILKMGYKNYPDFYNPTITVDFKANNNALVMDSYILSKNPTLVPPSYPNVNY